MAGTRERPRSRKLTPGGVYAVLGMDIVSFSLLHDEDQMQAIRRLMGWITEALAYHSLTEKDYRWSPAGDGGYISFTSSSGCRKAIDVAFSLFEKLQHPTWVPRTGEKPRIRAALHSGTLQEGHGLGRETNMWGMGINMTARILSLAASSQLLVSRQYFDTHIKEHREDEFVIGKSHSYTVKHGSKVEVMNISRGTLGLDSQTASSKRWRYIQGLWQKTVEEYLWLTGDTMKSGDSVATIAAAKFLHLLGEREHVRRLCEEIGRSQSDNGPMTHRLFGQMPAEMLYRVIEKIKPRILKPGEILCEEGAPALSSFFPVSGTVVVEVPNQREPIPIREGQIVGEFSLWIENLKRTARLRSLDGSLVLEMHNKDFTEILAGSAEVSNIIYSLVKGRITENVLKSSTLFPGIGPLIEDGTLSILAQCEKHPAGSEIDLSDAAYVIFSGAVLVQPADTLTLEIAGEGRIGFERVVGITSEVGQPDGQRAVVREEAVSVRIDHKTLRDLQNRFPAIDIAWNALYGRRLGEIRRLPSRGSNASSGGLG